MPSLSNACAGRNPFIVFSTMTPDSARTGCGIGLGVDHERARFGAVGDPHLGAVDAVTVADFFRARRHADESEPGPARSWRARRRARRLRASGDIALLRVGAEAPDLVQAQIRMRAVRQPEGARARLISSTANHMGEVTHAAPP